MGFRAFWRKRHEEKIRRYLQAHHGMTLDILRQDPLLGAVALREMGGLSAAQGTPDRQTMPYPILNQIGFGGRGPLSSTLPKSSAFSLRRFSEVPPARRAINAIANPILRLPWSLVPCDERLAETDADTWPAELRQRIAVATRCLQRPNGQDSWRVWLEQVLEDICVGGYGCSEIQQTDDPERPFWLWPVDGQSIRINVEWDGNPSTLRYTQSLGYVGLSVAMHDPVALRDDELLYMRLNPRAHTPFGLGYLEVAFNTVNGFLGAFDFAQRKASNATPNFLIFLGENVDIPTTRQWAQYWQQLIEGYGKAPIIGGGREPKVLDLMGSANVDPLYLKWQEWLVRIIAQAFGLSPMKLALERDINRSTSETNLIEDWETVAPVADTVADALTTHLFRGVLGWDDLCFKWHVRTTDDLRQSEVLHNRWESNSVTIDEQRALWGAPPLPDGRGQWTKQEWEALHAPGLSPLPTLGEEPEAEEPAVEGLDVEGARGTVAQNGTRAW